MRLWGIDSRSRRCDLLLRAVLVLAFFVPGAIVGHRGLPAQEPPDATKTESPSASSATKAVSASAPTAAEVRLKADVTYLAADAREGRPPGSKGIEASADYIAGLFKQLGLSTAPGAEGYFQTFSIPGRPRLAEPIELAALTPHGKIRNAEPKTEFSPLAIGASSQEKKLPIVFAGYGITAKDSALRLDYDDYGGIDVQGKAVLIIRREPQQNRDDSPFAGKKTTDYATFRHKASNAFQHGAACVLLVNDRAGLGNESDKVLGFMAGGPDTFEQHSFRHD